MNYLLKFLLLFLLTSITTLQASDYAKEKRWAEQTMDAIFDGEPLWLNADNHDFLSIYTESEDESNKAIIVVHGTGIHPDWEQVVQPIRVEMAALGWNTLSIQMPILNNEASYKEYVKVYPEVSPRLKAAEKFLLDKGMKTLVIAAHSQGSSMSAYYLSRNSSKVKAFVSIGMSATFKGSTINSAEDLEKISIPVFDLYGSDDLPDVLNSSSIRKKASNHNNNFKQQVVSGASHFFDDKNEALIEAIDTWLKSIFEK